MKLRISGGDLPIEEFPEIWSLGDIGLKWRGIPLPSIKEVRYVKTKGNQVDFEYYINVDKYLHHVISWIKKARAEKTGFDKFFSLWVAFNAFYRFYYEITERKEAGEKAQILKTKELLTESEISNFIKEYLPELGSITQSGFLCQLNAKNRVIL